MPRPVKGEAAERRLLAAWSRPVGTPVVVTLDDGSEWRTKTRSAPWWLCGHATILLEGKSGGYSLARVRVDEDAAKGGG